MKIHPLFNLNTLIITKTLVVAGAVMLLLMPAFAQDAPNSTADTGKQRHSDENRTGSQTRQGGNSSPPQQAQDATTGTSHPQGGDAPVVQGVNTEGTVRVNNWTNYEALINCLSNGLEIVLSIAGLWMLVRAFRQPNPTPSNWKQKPVDGRRLLWGLALIALGLSLPGTMNWFVASARDMSYFS